MPPDTVQIGSLVISKSLIDVLLPLLGTLIGGLISYLATTAAEDRKYRREKKDRLQEQQREALALALEWIEPIGNALTRATSVSRSLQMHLIDENQFLHDYPDLIASLANMDPPARLRVFLPKDAYPTVNEIVSELDTIKAKALSHGTLMECIELGADLSVKLGNLKNYLEDEYRKTFR